MNDPRRPDGEPGIDRLFDSEWLSIINSFNGLSHAEEDCVMEAIKETEKRMAAHFRVRFADMLRLEKIEKAAHRVCDEANATGTPSWPSVYSLAEACGREP
jgi:hypothetical protein